MVIGPLDGHTFCARSAFTHLGLWRKLYDCSLHHFTTSQSILACALLPFSSTSNRLAGIWNGDFSTPGFSGWWGHGGRGWAIRKPVHGFLLAPYWQICSISYRFELFSWLQGRFRSSVRPPARPSDQDTMTNTALSYRFVERQKLCSIQCVCFWGTAVRKQHKPVL